MDFNQLVEEIVARVAAKIEAESAPVAVPVDSGKPKLLILTQEHGTLCHQMLESPRLPNIIRPNVPCFRITSVRSSRMRRSFCSDWTWN